MFESEDEIKSLKERLASMTIIAYNAIIFGQLDQQYSKSELKEELDISDEEWDSIAVGDENLENMED